MTTARLAPGAGAAARSAGSAGGGAATAPSGGPARLRRALPSTPTRSGGSPSSCSARSASTSRPAGRTGASTRSPAARTHRRAAHHAHRPDEPARPRVFGDDPRGRPRALRAGLRRRALPHAAGRGAVDGAARVAVPALGERRRPQPRRSGRLLPAAPRGASPRRSAEWRSRSSTARSTGSSASLIRVEADEVTYNLHIVLRYELELRAAARRAAGRRTCPRRGTRRWSATSGLRPRDDVEGVLQDIHWAWGEFGYFPTYALGNLYAASLMRGRGTCAPVALDEVARGELGSLRDWLHEQVHRHGSRLLRRGARPGHHRARPHRRGLPRLPAREVRRALRSGSAGAPVA